MGNSKSVEVKDKEKEKEKEQERLSSGGGSATKKSSGAHRGSGYTFIHYFDRILSFPMKFMPCEFMVASDIASEII